MMIPMLLLISFIVYFGLQLTGIDPINFMVSPEMLSSNKENVEALRQSLGLNDPMIVQYFRWLGNCLHGDFGYSLKEGSSIASIIAVRLPYTFELAGYSLIFPQSLVLELVSFPQCARMVSLIMWDVFWQCLDRQFHSSL